MQIGKRFHSAPVVRIGDGKQLQLGASFLADGRWRLIAFAGQDDEGTPGSPVAKLCEFLSHSPQSPVKRFTAAGADVDSVIDVRAVFQQSHHTLAITALPGLLFPPKGRHGLHDYEKAFCALVDVTQNIYDLRSINKQSGCLLVLRPDQYIAQVLPLGDTDEFTRFFAGFMLNI